MDELLSKAYFEIKETEITNNKVKYNIKIKIPIEIGWIEDMKFILQYIEYKYKGEYIEEIVHKKAFQLYYANKDEEYVYFEGDIEVNTRAIYHYYFTFEANHRFIYYKNKNLGNTSSISLDEMWKISPNFKIADWAKGKIMYHIFVDRFRRGSKEKLKLMPRRTIYERWNDNMIIGPNKDGIWNADFYGGDLLGIIEKLEYIKSLGVSIIYLSPIVMSQSNHRYDASDYEIVDPYAGTNEDLKLLCDKAHELGMKIVLDAVFNHTGSDSKYFNKYGSFEELGAYQSSESKYFPFYRKHYANNQTYFDYWWGFDNLPECDGCSREWQQYIYGEGGIIDQWFALGIDGLRLDVADMLTDEFIEGIYTAVKRNKEDGFIIGEVWKNPMRENRSYITSGKGLETVMNYQLIDALIRYFKYEDVHKLNHKLWQLLNEYPTDTLNTLMNFTSTHDISRIIDIFGYDEFATNKDWAWNFKGDEDRVWESQYILSYEQYKKAKEIYKAYVFLLTFFPGILSIFYGDEIGMQGMGNLVNRKPFTWDNIDVDLLQFFKRMGKIRQQETFLQDANTEIVEINTQYIIFKRISKEESMYIIVNRSGDTIKVPIPEEYKDIEPSYSLGNSNKDSIASHGALVLKKKKDIN